MHRPRRLLVSCLLPSLFGLAWWWTSHSGSIAHLLLPTPESVWDAFCRLCLSGELWRDIVASGSRTLSGFGISAVTGLTLGFLLSRSNLAYRFFEPVLEALRITPPLALIPLLILWLGINEAPKIAIVVLSSFFPIFLNTLTALNSPRKDLDEVGQLLHFSQIERWRYLIIPQALPGLLTGLRLGFGYAWRALVGAELIAASSGLGWLITDSAEFGKTADVFVAILTIVVLGAFADFIFKTLVTKGLQHWGACHDYI